METCQHQHIGRFGNQHDRKNEKLSGEQDAIKANPLVCCDIMSATGFIVQKTKTG